MSLSVLEPEFLKIESGSDNEQWRLDATFKDADGVWFLCPKCWLKNGRSAVGTHMMICWRPHISQKHSPSPGRWQFQGTGLQDLSLVAGSSSIQILGGCNAHFWIRNGNIEDLT